MSKDREIWDAMDVLGNRIDTIARENVAANPRGATGRLLEQTQADAARCARMELTNTISRLFAKYQ